METWQLLILPIVGLAAGVLGGLLGVGGSVVMIPAMVLLLGQGLTPGYDQHLYQAAAMLVNVAIAGPAAYRHAKAGAVMRAVVIALVPGALLGIVLGVLLSNTALFAGPDGVLWLQRAFGAFAAYVALLNARKWWQAQHETNSRRATLVGSAAEPPVQDQAKPPVTRTAPVGLATGLIAGLLGIGGGALAVPLQQLALKLDLRNCIANSAMTITVTAGIGAAIKLATLDQHGSNVTNAWLLFACLAPTGVVGSLLGAKLTHRLPTTHVRLAFVLLMAVVSIRLLAG
ncbi:MAG: sulfite exporter TauE/SafE family protein [Planctomycetota bacterium]